MNKKVIIILLGVFLLIIITLGIVLVVTSKSTTSDTATTIETPADRTLSLPDPAPVVPEVVDTGSDTVVVEDPVVAPPALGANKLTTDEVVGASLFYQGDALSYFDPLGNFYQSKIQTADNGDISLVDTKPVAVEKKAGLVDVSWPLSGNNFLAEVSDQVGKKSFVYFDGDKNKYFSLPESIVSVDWLGGYKKIAYIWQDKSGAITLNASAPDGSGFVSLAKISYKDVNLKASDSGQNFLFYRTNNPSGTNKIYLISGDGKLFKTVVNEGYNYGVSFAPDNHRFLFSRRNINGQYDLWVGDISGDEARPLGVVSYVDKAVWSKDSSFVVVYGKQSNNQSQDQKEMFYKIDTRTFEREAYDPIATVDPKDLFLSLKEDVLYFKNNIGGMLYYIKLHKEHPDPLPTNTGTKTTPISNTSNLR